MNDLTLGIGHAGDDDGLLVEGLNLELRAVEGRAAERVASAGLEVVLGDFHAAAHDVILGGEGIHLTVLGDGHPHLGGGVEVIVVGGSLADDVLAEGQAVRRGLRHAVLVSDDGLHRLTGIEVLAIDRDRVRVVVDDGERDAAEISTALRGLSGLGIELLDRHAAANHRLRDFRKIEGRDTFQGVLLNLLEVYLVIQFIASRSLGLVNGNGTARNGDISTIVTIKIIARYKIAIRQFGISIFVSVNHPTTSRVYTGLLDGIVVIVIHGIEILDGKLGTLKRGGALRHITL